MRTHAVPILPIGTVNLLTGANVMFGSMWDCWEESDKAYDMLVQFKNGKFKIVHTSGEGDEVGLSQEFVHDQTRRSYGIGRVVACEPHTKAGLTRVTNYLTHHFRQSFGILL